MNETCMCQQSVLCCTAARCHSCCTQEGQQQSVRHYLTMIVCPDVSVSLTSKGAEPKNIMRAVQVAPDGFCMLSHAFAEPCRKQAILEFASRCQNAERSDRNVHELGPLWRSCGASNGNMQFVEWHVAGSSVGSTKGADARAAAALPHPHVQSVQLASCHSQPHRKNAVRCCCDPHCIV